MERDKRLLENHGNWVVGDYINWVCCSFPADRLEDVEMRMYRPVQSVFATNPICSMALCYR
jgi:hypothetical protein